MVNIALVRGRAHRSLGNWVELAEDRRGRAGGVLAYLVGISAGQ